MLGWILYRWYNFWQNSVSLYWSLIQDRNNLIASLITTRLAWIDGSDIAQEGVFKDSDGNNLSYLNFNIGEPNGGGSENCLAIWEGGQSWADLGCERIEEYVCAKEGKQYLIILSSFSW